MSRKPPKLLSHDQDALLRSELVRLASELHPITVRGLYYQAVVSALLDYITKDSLGSRVNYNLVQTRVLNLRKAGVMSWEWVVDESRASYWQPRWVDPSGFAWTAPHYYRLDFWREQRIRPLVIVEKAGQIPVYLQHARQFGLDVVACKGYGSASYLRSVALSVDEHIREGQAIQLLVCADFDPSGDDWPRAALEEIQSHVSEPEAVTMQRVLVTRDDLDGFGALVALRGANKNDSRTMRFLERHGFMPEQEVCVEMDAMNPAEARQRIEDIALDLFDGDLEKERNIESEQREQITMALKSLS
ncbi:hypothetical protein [Synechococcus sp. UW105]|uniref:hypothetical protein n=1 Tax=Synechococcus sp. UW105 TaxID=337067 RepID=UPI000E0FDE6F|nr:hypothetical protein [Synechococcus sp. UW105]